MKKKYILDEPKLFLKEPSTLILDERLVLQEADEDTVTETQPGVTLLSIATDIKNMVCGDDTNKGLSAKILEKNKNSVTLDNLTKTNAQNPETELIQAQKVADSAVGSGDNTKAMGDIKAYARKFKDVINKNGLLNKVQVANKDALTKLLKDIEVETDKAKLITKYQTLKDSITKAFSSDNQYFTDEIKNKIMEATSHIKSFKLIDKYNKYLTEADLNAAKATLLDAKNKLSGINVNAPHDKAFFDNYTNLLSIVVSAETTVTDAINDRQQRVDAKDQRDKSTNLKADWDKMYKAATTTEEMNKFWFGDPNGLTEAARLGYYKGEWGAQAEKIKSFGAAFIQELKVFGWDAISNPFIQFLKENLKNLPSLDETTYPILHNLVANRTIEYSDIRGTGLFGKSNLVFNNNWYESSLSDIKGYAELQSRLQKEQNKLPVKAKEVLRVSPEKFIKNVLLDMGDGITFSANPPANSALKPFARARQTVNQLLGIGRTAANEAEVAAIVDTVDKHTQAAQKVTAHLVDALRLNQQEIVDNVNKKTNGKLLDLYDRTNLTYKERQTLDRQLRLTDKNFTADQLTDMLLQLAEKAGIYAPTQSEANA